MTNYNHINTFKYKLRTNKVKYSAAAGTDKTTHDVNFSFSVPDVYSIKIRMNHLHVDNAQGYEGIGYGMIIGHDLMVQLGLNADF